jgi:hypothetical protein
VFSDGNVGVPLGAEDRSRSSCSDGVDDLEWSAWTCCAMAWVSRVCELDATGASATGDIVRRVSCSIAV